MYKALLGGFVIFAFGMWKGTAIIEAIGVIVILSGLFIVGKGTTRRRARREE